MGNDKKASVSEVGQAMKGDAVAEAALLEAAYRHLARWRISRENGKALGEHLQMAKRHYRVVAESKNEVMRKIGLVGLEEVHGLEALEALCGLREAQMGEALRMAEVAARGGEKGKRG